MTKRAERLAEYLAVALDWTVFPGDRWCSKCDRYSTHGNWGDFCPRCGTKLDPEDRSATLRDLEGAIKYALGKGTK